MQGTGRRSVAVVPIQYAVPFFHERLDRLEQLVEAEFRGRAGEAESATRALPGLHEARAPELAKELGEVVRGSLDSCRDVSRVREGTGSQSCEQGKSLEGMDTCSGKDGFLLNANRMSISVIPRESCLVKVMMEKPCESMDKV